MVRAECGWTVTRGRLMVSSKFLGRKVLAYRRCVRQELANNIRAIELRLLDQVGDSLPLAARLTRTSTAGGRENVYGRTTLEEIRCAIGGTRPRAFQLRYWQGATVSGRTSLLMYRGGSGIDELEDTLRCCDDVPQEGRFSHLERFMITLEQLRTLRQGYAGMLTRGINAALVDAGSAVEQELNELLLGDDITTATNRLRKALAEVLAPQSKSDSVRQNRQIYRSLVLADASDDEFGELIDPFEQSLLWVAGLTTYLSWQEIVRRQLSLCNDRPSLGKVVSIKPQVPKTNLVSTLAASF